MVCRHNLAFVAALILLSASISGCGGGGSASITPASTAISSDSPVSPGEITSAASPSEEPNLEDIIDLDTPPPPPLMTGEPEVSLERELILALPQ